MRHSLNGSLGLREDSCPTGFDEEEEDELELDVHFISYDLVFDMHFISFDLVIDSCC